MKTKDIRVIFLNGPPGAGKDTAAQAICSHLSSISQPLKFAAPLKRCTEIMLSVTPFELEDLKAEVILEAERPGYTYRQFLIDMSEDFIKPRLGRSAFGKMAWRRLERDARYKRSLFVFSDCGFRAEAEYIIRQLTPEQCLLIRLFRNGCNFDFDSRNYISLEGVKTIDVENSGLIDDFKSKMRTAAVDWLTNNGDSK